MGLKKIKNGLDNGVHHIEANQLRREFSKVCKKGFHATRHSYITYKAGEFKDLILVRNITGHRSEAFESYLHIYERIAEETAKKAKRGNRRKKFKKAG